MPHERSPRDQKVATESRGPIALDDLGRRSLRAQGAVFDPQSARADLGKHLEVMRGEDESSAAPMEPSQGFETSFLEHLVPD